MKLLTVENDWKLQLNEITGKLQQARESRDIKCRQEMRVRHAYNEHRVRHKSELESLTAHFEEKLETQKMECSSLAHELKSEIMTLNNSLFTQEKQIKEFEEQKGSFLEEQKGSLLEEQKRSLVTTRTAVAPPSTSKGIETKGEYVANQIANVEEINTARPKRLRRIRNLLSRVKKRIRK